jgi:dsRNA-specific ribonuclease
LQPLEAEQPTHRYTSKLYEYAAGSKKSPEYSKEWVSSDVWRCEAVFNDIHGVGEARSWKDARHIASQKICETLGITEN